MPQPRAYPSAFRQISKSVNPANAAASPKRVYKKPLRTFCGLQPPNFVKAKTLSAKTGNTQGIKLRIKPPRTASPIMPQPRTGSSVSNNEAFSGRINVRMMFRLSSLAVTSNSFPSSLLSCSCGVSKTSISSLLTLIAGWENLMPSALLIKNSNCLADFFALNLILSICPPSGWS